MNTKRKQKPYILKKARINNKNLKPIRITNISRKSDGERFAQIALLGEYVFHADDFANLWNIRNKNTLYKTGAITGACIVSAIPSYEIHYRTLYGDIVSQEGGDATATSGSVTRSQTRVTNKKYEIIAKM